MKQKILLLVVALVLMSTSLFAADFTVNGIHYNILSAADKTVAVTFEGSSYSTVANEYTGDVTIPATVQYGGYTYNVTAIGNNAFRNCMRLTSITIPEGVTTIGSAVFQECTNLTSAIIAEGVQTISRSAFQSCISLTSVTISKGVTSIGVSAFHNCEKLTSVTLPEGVITIDSLAFRDCSGLESIIIPEGVTTINTEAFYRCTSLTKVTFPSSVTYIGSSAFYGCTGITEITCLPTSVPEVKEYTFLNVPTTIPVYVPVGSVTKYQKTDYWKNFTNIQAFTFEVDGIHYAYLGEDNVEVCFKGAYWDSFTGEYTGDVTIPATVSYDGKTYNVTVIGESSFQNCSGLTGITIPSGVTTIGNSAFMDCTGLTSVTIPSSVTTIDNNAFAKCTSFTEITSLASVPPTAESYTFYKVPTTIPVYVPASSVAAYKAANYWKNFTNIQAIPAPEVGDKFEVDGIAYKYIGGDSVEVTSKTDQYTGDVEIPATVEYNGTTYNVTAIGNVAFNGCSGLTSVTIPSSVKYIGNYAFFGCSILASLTIEEGVEEIASGVFLNCTSLTAITFPASVTKIGTYAFQGCTGVKEITSLATTPPTAGSYAFFDIPTTIPIYVPASSVAAYQAANRWKDFTNIQAIVTVLAVGDKFEVDGIHYKYLGGDSVEVTFEGSSYSAVNEYTGDIEIPATVTHGGTTYNVTAIGKQAFQKCADLTSVIIPSGVTIIGFEAFRACTSLTKITIPSSVTSIGEYAFFGCNKLTTVTLPSGVTTIGSSTFSGCSSLAEITIPSGVTTIGSSMFNGCTSLTEITIPSGVTTIGTHVFYGCTGLESITIPSSVTSIGMYAFYGCTGLTEITCLATTPPTVGSLYPFTNVPTTIPVYVPASSVAAYKAANHWKNFTNIQVVKYTITVTASPAEGGTVTGGGEYTDGTTATINAMPNEGYEFVKWTSGETEYEEVELTFEVTEAAEYTATFRKKSPATGVETPYAGSELSPRKVLENGTIYIIRNGEKYTVDGKKVM